MSEASKFAQELADDLNLDLSDIEGTGKDGLIRKDDVRDHIKALEAQIPGTLEIPERAPLPEGLRYAKTAPGEPLMTEIDPDSPVYATVEVPLDTTSLDRAVDPRVPEPERYTNIMEAQKAATARLQAENEPKVPGVDRQVAGFTQEQMFDVILDLQREVGALKEANASRIEREHYERDLTDEMLFIAKPGGEKWEERQIIDKQTVMVEYIATAFFGPFQDQEMVDSYLKEKLSKREDSYIRWENINIMTGRDARSLQRREKEERQREVASEVSTNVLDRRIFESQIAGAQPQTRNPHSEQEWVEPPPVKGLPSARNA